MTVVFKNENIYISI